MLPDPLPFVEVSCLCHKIKPFGKIKSASAYLLLHFSLIVGGKKKANTVHFLVIIFDLHTCLFSLSRALSSKNFWGYVSPFLNVILHFNTQKNLQKRENTMQIALNGLFNNYEALN